MVVGKGGRRGRRADDDVELLEKDAPLLFHPLARKIDPEPVPVAHERSPHEFCDEALVGGGNLPAALRSS